MRGEAPSPPSEYRAMWLLAMFDLPVDTKANRADAARFRKDLLREGFSMLQFSVYARFCGSEDSAEVHRRRIRAALPDCGEVRILSVTDKQFGKTEVFRGKRRSEVEMRPDQLALF